MWSPMQSARLAGALVQAPRGSFFVWLLHTDGSWRLADAGESRVGGLGGVRGNAIAFA